MIIINRIKKIIFLFLLILAIIGLSFFPKAKAELVTIYDTNNYCISVDKSTNGNYMVSGRTGLSSDGWINMNGYTVHATERKISLPYSIPQNNQFSFRITAWGYGSSNYNTPTNETIDLYLVDDNGNEHYLESPTIGGYLKPDGTASYDVYFARWYPTSWFNFRVRGVAAYQHGAPFYCIDGISMYANCDDIPRATAASVDNAPYRVGNDYWFQNNSTIKTSNGYRDTEVGLDKTYAIFSGTSNLCLGNSDSSGGWVSRNDGGFYNGSSWKTGGDMYNRSQQFSFAVDRDMDLVYKWSVVSTYGIFLDGATSPNEVDTGLRIHTDGSPPTSSSVSATLVDNNNVRIDLTNCTDSRSGLSDGTVKVAIWKDGESYRDWYTLTRVQETNNFTATINLENNNTKGQYGLFNAHVYAGDNVGNSGFQAGTTFQRTNPVPINGGLVVKDYDYKESNSVYWMKTGNQFRIYNDGYFPSTYGMYPSQNYVLFQKDGTEGFDTAARYYSDTSGHYSYGSSFNQYFGYTNSYIANTFQGLGRNYLASDHVGKGLVDNTSFLLYHCTTYLSGGTQYYNGYVNSGIWMKFDGKAPTYTRSYATNYTTSGYDVVIEGVSDNGGSGVKSITMPTYTAANGKDDLQTYSFIKTAYSDLLQRQPSSNELNYYATNIGNGVLNEKDLINDLTHDISFNISDDSQFVSAIYDTFFNRYPSQDEDEGWSQNLALGFETRESFVNYMYNNDEFNSFRTTAKNLGSGKYMVHVDISQHNYEIANYNTDICLRDNVGNYTIVTVSANINQKPSAKFTVISPILANTNITYTDYASSGDSWDSIKSDTWQWSIDNKTWTSGKPTKFDVSQFPLSAAYGDYYIRRQVVDTGHGTDSITSDWYTQTLRVYRYNTKPTAYFTATSPQYIGFTIQYTESSSPQDQWDSIVAKEWSYSLDGGKTWSAPSTVPPSKFDNPGVYKVRLRVKDTGNILSPGIWSDYYIQDIQILDLSVVGEVKHTDRWNENRIKYNRSKTGKDDDPRTYDVFFPGEMFVLSSVTTIPANGVSVEIQGTSFSTDLASDDGITWSGQLWDESMIDWTDRSLNFIFTAKYPNNITKQCIVPVKVVYDEYWRQHREF